MESGVKKLTWTEMEAATEQLTNDRLPAWLAGNGVDSKKERIAYVTGIIAAYWRVRYGPAPGSTALRIKDGVTALRVWDKFAHVHIWRLVDTSQLGEVPEGGEAPQARIWHCHELPGDSSDWRVTEVPWSEYVY